MLVMNPDVVRFGEAVWEDVSLVAVDRAAERVVLEWGDAGPHAVLADVPERRVTVRVVREPVREDDWGPELGEAEELVFYTSPAASRAGRKRVRATAVVTSVRHEIVRGQGARRVISLAAVSPDGSADPVTVEDALFGSE